MSFQYMTRLTGTSIGIKYIRPVDRHLLRALPQMP